MPVRSERQRRYLYLQASRGEKWARKFLRDSGEKPPKRKRVKRR